MLRYVVLAGIFALPFIVLIVSRSLFFPFITGKNFSFRIIVEVISGAWLALALISPLYRPKRSWILFAFTAFVLSIGVSDAIGVNPFKSFWSNYERMEGWVTLAHLLLFFLVAVAMLNTERLWKRWWQVSLSVSAVVGLYGLLQLAGFITINQGGVRLDATLGNATYLAIYMLFHIFMAALFLAKSFGEDKQSDKVNAVLFYGGIIVLDLFILFFTATRGAILGLIGGVLLAALLYVIQERGTRGARNAGIVAAGILVLMGGLYLARDSAFVRNVGPLARLASIPTDMTARSRFINWSMAWEGVKERPFFGWGQENYAVVFDKHYDPRMYAQEPWFDRVHNIVFDWLIAGGIVGFLLYASIFVAALAAIWRGFQNGNAVFSPSERSILTGLLAAYVFFNLFVFDNVISYLLFFSVLAYIAVRSSLHGAPLFEWSLPKHSFPLAAAGAVMLVWGSAWFVNAHALSANKTLIFALSPHQEGAAKNLEYFKESIAYGTYGTQEAREHLSQGATQVIMNQQVPLDVRRGFLETAAKEMSMQAESSPLNARFPFFLGVLLDAAGDYQNARIALQRAHELSPNKQSILFEMGLNALARNANDEALHFFKTAYELAPDYHEARTFYTTVAVYAGNTEIENMMIPIMIENDQALEPRLLSAYRSLNRYDKIAFLAAAHIERMPNDPAPRLTYMAALYKMGESEEAVAVLQEMKRALPQTAAQADTLIEEIRSGTLQI